MRRESRRFAVAILHAVEAVLRFCAILFIATPCIVLNFYVFNRTRVIGRENLNELWKLVETTKRGAFLCSTHYTMLDSWVLLFALSFPHMLWDICRLPWSLPDWGNYGSVPGISHLLRLYHTIPVERPSNPRSTGKGRNLGSLRLMRSIINAQGVIQVFYQGGRTVDAISLGTPKPPVMSMVLSMDAHVAPVLLTGTRDVQPYRKNPGDPPATAWRMIPFFGKQLEWLFHARFGNVITITVGKPWALEQIEHDLAGVSKEERTARFTELFMERMEALRGPLEDRKGHKEAVS